MPNYLARWPNGEVSIVFGRNRGEVLRTLDEFGDPSECELIPISSGAINLKLGDAGDLRLEELTEGLEEVISSKAFPLLNAELNRLVDEKIEEDSRKWRSLIRAIVPKERRRKIKSLYSCGVDVTKDMYGKKLSASVKRQMGFRV